MSNIEILEDGTYKINGLIPFILPSNMSFDETRNKLWWVDKKTVYSANYNANEIFLNDVSGYVDGLACVSTIFENGFVLVGGYKSGKACLLVIDKNNRGVIEKVNIPDSNVINPN